METHDTEELSAVKSVLGVARQMIRGDMDALTACRTLVRLRWHLPEPNRRDLLTIVGIESELDDVPGPQHYQVWEAKALARKLAARDRYLDEVDGALRDAFTALELRLSRYLEDGQL